MLKPRASLILLFCWSIVPLRGCRISIATYGMIVYVRGEGHHTATVQLKAMPNEVYAARVSHVEEQPDIISISVIDITVTYTNDNIN